MFEYFPLTVIMGIVEGMRSVRLDDYLHFRLHWGIKINYGFRRNDYLISRSEVQSEIGASTSTDFHFRNRYLGVVTIVEKLKAVHSGCDLNRKIRVTRE